MHRDHPLSIDSFRSGSLSLLVVELITTGCLVYQLMQKCSDVIIVAINSTRQLQVAKNEVVISI